MNNARALGTNNSFQPVVDGAGECSCHMQDKNDKTF